MATEVKQPVKKAKVWKGEKRSGPAPARHIPWPEIFKHHISVVEGHTKMLEMVQKHTVKGTGNYETITNLVKRSHEMMWQAKDVSRSFVPPKNQREMVPLGSSSESMYPGYSPAHIEYGQAAGEFGQAVGEMKARGEEWKPANGTEYQIGQAHGAKRKMFFQKDSAESAGSKGATKFASAEPATKEEPKEEETLGFVIDINPTPVKVLGSSTKRPLEDESEGAEKKKDKKKKKLKEDNGEKEPVIETEDISAEVDARLRAKEEKKKSKGEKKRRRESAGEDEEKVAKKSRKDKYKKREAEDGEEGSGDGEGKKKRRKNKDVE